MLHKRMTLAMTIFLALAIALPLAAQMAKRLSPHESVELSVNGKKIRAVYGRPYMKGRKIMGGLVPYGQVWRTGADEATVFTTEADLVMDGVTIRKGSYTLFTLPSEGTWKLIINKQTGQWGTDYDESQDLARIELKKEILSQPVEQFTISLEKRGASNGVMKLAWEKTLPWVEFTLKG